MLSVILAAGIASALWSWHLAVPPGEWRAIERALRLVSSGHARVLTERHSGYLPGPGAWPA
jgi:hypothetical protein